MADERQYVIPLRKEWLKVPRFKRAKKGTKAVREFCAKHFRVEMENVKIGKWLNEQIWARGMKNPPHKIKVRASKDDKGIVKVELFELHEQAKKFEEKESKRKTSIDGKKKDLEAKKKAEEEAAKKEMEALEKKDAETLQKKEEEIKKEHQDKADKAQEVNKGEEKLLKKETAKDHHAKVHTNLPHEKAQSKHPVRQTLEK